MHFLLWAKGSHESTNFDTFNCYLIKLCKIPHVIFQIITSFSYSFVWLFSVMKDNCLVLVRSNLIYFVRNGLTKCKSLRLLSAQIKINQILVIFETNRFFFKFCITLQYHETKLLGTFLAEILYTFNKRILLNYKFVEISREQPKVWNLHVNGLVL